MKLCHNKASPYVRKVLITVHEKELANRIELVPTDPWPDLAEWFDAISASPSVKATAPAG